MFSLLLLIKSKVLMQRQSLKWNSISWNWHVYGMNIHIFMSWSIWRDSEIVWLRVCGCKLNLGCLNFRLWLLIALTGTILNLHIEDETHHSLFYEKIKIKYLLFEMFFKLSYLNTHQVRMKTLAWCVLKCRMKMLNYYDNLFWSLF